jgi:hypothetical protein
MQDARERTERLAGMLVDSRKRTLQPVSDLSDEQMIGPRPWNLHCKTNDELAPWDMLEWRRPMIRGTLHIYPAARERWTGWSLEPQEDVCEGERHVALPKDGEWR